MAIPKRTETLSGWGHVPVAECVTMRPERQRELDAIVAPPVNEEAAERESLIARGLGRSYGDASLNPVGVVRMERIDHILSFDAISGILTAEAGVTLADILRIAVPQGWILPIIPGTKHISIGGAFACNVHGKNACVEGEFARHTLTVTIRLADGLRVTCSAHDHSDLFWATAGGMGLTGIIEDITIQLKRIDSASLKAESRTVFHLDEMLDCFEESRASAEYMIGWIDHTAKDDQLGKGVFEKARHIGERDGGKPLASFGMKPPRINVPFTLPRFVLNKQTMAIYNKLRFFRYRREWRKEIKSFAEFFHPLDGIGNWHRLYGRRGFFQYQCLIPDNAEVRERLHDILQLIHERGCFSYLAVLKYHGDHQGLLSFGKRGYSLALDFPNTRRVRELITELNEYVASIGGRVYLAKDALLTAGQFSLMYADKLTEWQKAVAKADPERRFSSLMAERLQMRGGYHGA